MSKDDELVLVVPSNKLFSAQGGPASGWEGGVWQGLKTDNLDYYLELIKNNCEFKRRGDVETDNGFQQIIPYILFSFENKFFAYKYLANAGEQRLVNNDYQLGVGGHINKEDIKDGKDILEEGMMREWEEEVDFKGNLISKKLVGIINDDSHPVEQVHLGLVYHFVGDSSDIQVKETDKMEGKLLDASELSADKIGHSVWMQIVYQNYLSKLN
jgi:predicted NUDIX family phosphoesterase